MSYIRYHVEVLLNTTEDEDGRIAIFARFHDEPRYQPGDTLESVWSGEMLADETHEDILELVFARFNRGSGSFIGDMTYPHRSLSVGDCVRLDEVTMYVCEPSGWKEIPA